MPPPLSAILVVMGLATLAISASLSYFNRWRLTLPPLGVINAYDLTLNLVSIVLIPLLYINLPLTLNTILLTTATAGLLYTLLEPLVPWRSLRWALTLTPVAADIAAAWLLGADSLLFIIINDGLVVLTVIGVANLWVQGGMKAWHLAVQALALVAYDFTATARMTVTLDMMNALAAAPFAPLLVWPAGADGWLGYGIGDLLMAAAFPIAMRKGYGRKAGIFAAMFSMLSLAGVIMGLQGLLKWVGASGSAFPTMVVLGPLIFLQYAWWRCRRGPERRMRDYWSEPDGSAG